MHARPCACARARARSWRDDSVEQREKIRHARGSMSFGHMRTRVHSVHFARQSVILCGVSCIMSSSCVVEDVEQRLVGRRAIEGGSALCATTSPASPSGALGDAQASPPIVLTQKASVTSVSLLTQPRGWAAQPRAGDSHTLHSRVVVLMQSSDSGSSDEDSGPASDDDGYEYDEFGQRIYWEIELERLQEEVKKLKQENAILRAQLAELTSAVGADGS